MGDQAFLRSYDSAPRPPPPLSREHVVLSQSSSWVVDRSYLLEKGEGEGEGVGRGAKSYNHEKALLASSIHGQRALWTSILPGVDCVVDGKNDATRHDLLGEAVLVQLSRV